MTLHLRCEHVVPTESFNIAQRIAMSVASFLKSYVGKNISFLLMICVLIPITEEIIFRYFIYNITLYIYNYIFSPDGNGLLITQTINVLLFAYLHKDNFLVENFSDRIVQFVYVFSIGYSGYIITKQESLLMCFALHISFNSIAVVHQLCYNIIKNSEDLKNIPTPQFPILLNYLINKLRAYFFIQHNIQNIDISKIEVLSSSTSRADSMPRVKHAVRTCKEFVKHVSVNEFSSNPIGLDMPAEYTEIDFHVYYFNNKNIQKILPSINTYKTKQQHLKIKHTPPINKTIYQHPILY